MQRVKIPRAWKHDEFNSAMAENAKRQARGVKCTTVRKKKKKSTFVFQRKPPLTTRLPSRDNSSSRLTLSAAPKMDDLSRVHLTNPASNCLIAARNSSRKPLTNPPPFPRQIYLSPLCTPEEYYCKLEDRRYQKYNSREANAVG